jgi:hypothetical protein
VTVAVVRLGAEGMVIDPDDITREAEGMGHAVAGKVDSRGTRVEPELVVAVGSLGLGAAGGGMRGRFPPG